MSDTLYLVDTFSLLFQVFFAIRQPMTGTRGAAHERRLRLHGDIEHLIGEKQPSHLIFAMESPEPGERINIFAEYKAHREEMPNDLRPQVGMILELLEAYRIPVVSYPRLGSGRRHRHAQPPGGAGRDGGPDRLERQGCHGSSCAPSARSTASASGSSTRSRSSLKTGGSAPIR